MPREQQASSVLGLLSYEEIFEMLSDRPVLCKLTVYRVCTAYPDRKWRVVVG
jgi:hypothetical protein